MTTAVRPATPPLPTLHPDAVCWEQPDTALAHRFGGIAMVQSFAIALPDGEHGRCWLPTAVALRRPGLGRAWIAGRLAARIELLGWDAVRAELLAADGLRLD
jgi:hypothetical protein